jgi:hypothetical protein
MFSFAHSIEEALKRKCGKNEKQETAMAKPEKLFF